MAEETLGTEPGQGISGTGTTLQGATTGPIGMLTKIAIDGVELDEIDVTTMNSPKISGVTYKVFIKGLADAKQATLDLVYEAKNTSVLFYLNTLASDIFTITFPDTSTWVQTGWLKKLGLAIPNGDKITQSVILRFTGPPTFNSGSGSDT